MWHKTTFYGIFPLHQTSGLNVASVVTARLWLGIIPASKLQGSTIDAFFVSPIPFIPIDIQARHGSKYLTSGVRGELQCKVSTSYVLSDGVYRVRDFEVRCQITCQIQSHVLIP